VAAETVQQRDVIIEQTFVGTVTPTRTSLVGSPVEGLVTTFHVQEGDFVQQGDKLAQLRLTRLEIELAGAQAELALLKNQLEDLEVSLPIEIEEAEARQQVAEALKQYASGQYQRGQQLEGNATITRAEIDQLRSAAESSINVLGERTAALKRSIQTGPVKIAQAKSRIKVQEEAIRELQDTIEQHTILAPFDGYISQEHTEVGQWIAKGGPIAEIVELSEVEIVLPVLETRAGELQVRTSEHEGTRTQNISVEAYPDEKFQGEVTAIVPRADYQARTFPVKVRVQNRFNPATNMVMLKPGMFARVTLPVRAVKDAVMIPKDALVLDRRSPTVWQIISPAEANGPGGSSIRSLAVEVDPDVSLGDWIQLTGPVSQDGSLPLAAGDIVITEGNERVNLRSTVTITNRNSSE
jgi:RND family efflux transporter MFP subunit